MTGQALARANGTMVAVPAQAAGARFARGQWLREQRRARGWNIPEMCRQLRSAAASAGDKVPGNDVLNTMIRRWEKDNGGVSERYRLYFCRAFCVPPDQFGTAPVPASPTAGETPASTAGAAGDGPEGKTAPDGMPVLLWPVVTVVIAPACCCTRDHGKAGERIPAG